jgi:hypothetical protein
VSAPAEDSSLAAFKTKTLELALPLIVALISSHSNALGADQKDNMPEPLISETVNHSEGDADVTDTSDHLHAYHASVQYLSDQADVLWVHKAERQERLAWGFRYDRADGIGPAESLAPHIYSYDRPVALVSEKFNDRTQLDASSGVNFYRASSAYPQASSFFVGGAELVSRPTDESTLRLSVNRHLLVEDLLIVNDFSNPVATISGKESGSWTWASKYKVQQFVEREWINDGNRRWNLDLAGMYGISQHPVWAWVGVGANYFSYDHRKTNYWSPYQMIALGPRVDFAIPFWDQWQYKIGGSLNWLREESFAQAVGDYVRTALSYRPRDGTVVEIYYIDSRSTRSNSSWFGESVGINFSWVY